MNQKERSADLMAYFDAFGCWHQHFPSDVIAEAREYYRYALIVSSREAAAGYAWSYAQGAIRDMKLPSPPSQAPTS